MSAAQADLLAALERAKSGLDQERFICLAAQWGKRNSGYTGSVADHAARRLVEGVLEDAGIELSGGHFGNVLLLGGMSNELADTVEVTLDAIKLLMRHMVVDMLTNLVKAGRLR